MVIKRKIAFILILFFFSVGICHSQVLVNYTEAYEEELDYENYVENTTSEDTFLRIGLNQRKGTFNIAYLTDPRTRYYQPLLHSENPATSFFSVLVNDVAYKPASDRQFKKRIGKQHEHPYLEFNAPFMIIRQIFAPVKTENSSVTNGVKMVIMLKNKSNKNANIGMRILLDTSLGEAKGRVPFITNNQLILKEKLINGKGEDTFWISRGDTVSLMGSIGNPKNNIVRKPDYIHFASWKKLSSSKWAINYKENRPFHELPYSINDSAVCYYFLPKSVEPGETIAFTVFLTTDDPDWYNWVPPELPKEEDNFEEEFIRVFELEYSEEYENGYEYGPVLLIDENYNEDVIYLDNLYEFQEKIANFLEGEIELDEEDLLLIERSIKRLQNEQ